MRAYQSLFKIRQWLLDKVHIPCFAPRGLSLGTVLRMAPSVGLLSEKRLSRPSVHLIWLGFFFLLSHRSFFKYTLKINLLSNVVCVTVSISFGVSRCQDCVKFQGGRWWRSCRQVEFKTPAEYSGADATEPVLVKCLCFLKELMSWLLSTPTSPVYILGCGQLLKPGGRIQSYEELCCEKQYRRRYSWIICSKSISFDVQAFSCIQPDHQLVACPGRVLQTLRHSCYWIVRWCYVSALWKKTVSHIQMKLLVIDSRLGMVARTSSKTAKISHSRDPFMKVLLGPKEKKGCASLGYLVCF